MILFQEKSTLNRESSVPILLSLLPIIFFFIKDQSIVLLYFLISFTIIIVSIFLWLYFSIYILKVDHENIFYNFSPFRNKKFKKIKFSEIQILEFTPIDPIQDFGGLWGVRKSENYGKGYLINGENKGLFIKKKNGEKFFFCVKEVEKLENIITNITLNKDNPWATRVC